MVVHSFGNIVSEKLAFTPSKPINSLNYSKKSFWKTLKIQLESIESNLKKESIVSLHNDNAKTIDLLTTTNLSLWSENVIKYTLQKNDISVVTKDPNIKIKGVLNEFFISGNDSAEGKISIDLIIRNNENTSLFKGEITKIIKSACSSHNANICFQLISDLWLSWIEEFLNHPEVLNAITETYYNTVILHDFNTTHRNLITKKNIPKKKPVFKKIGTAITCAALAPILTGVFKRSLGDGDLGEKLILIGSTAASAGMATAGISFAFDIKYHSFQSKFRKKVKLPKIKKINTEEEQRELTLNTLPDS